MHDLPLPKEFRTEILQQVLSILRSGESCALVGVGSSGKSNIARHLTRADVRLHYFEASAAQVFVLYLNCKPFAHRAPHDLYLHALDQLIRAIEELDGAFTPLQPGVNALWQEAQANPPSLAKRNLDKAIDQVVRAGAEHMIIILDDCEDLFAKALPILFTDLRELRDNHKLRVVYLTLTRREPAFLRTDTREYEELFELLSPAGHTIPVPPYVQRDGFHMLQRLAARQDPPHRLSETEVRLLFELGGGHGGLIRSLYFATQHSADLLTPDTLDRLAAHADVEAECHKILDSLEEDERADLRGIVRRETPSADGLRRLQQRGLIHPSLAGSPGIFSSVFERFLRQQFGPAPESIQIEFPGVGWQVWINGELIVNLNWPEFEILRRLAEKRPQACPIAELIETMRLAERGKQEDRAQGNPLERLNQYVQQLKAKMGPAGQFIRQEGDSYRLTGQQ